MATLSRLGSPQAASRRVAIAKPKNDVYVALLGIALGAVVIGCILLALEYNRYRGEENPKTAQVYPRSVALAQLACDEAHCGGPLQFRIS